MKFQYVLWWKIYFYLFTGIFLFDLVVNTFEDTWGLYKVGALSLDIFSILGLWGFVWQKKVLDKEFWKIYSIALPPIELGWLLSSNWFSEIIQKNEWNFLEVFIIFIIMSPFWLPKYIALYLYGRQSNRNTND